MLDAQALADRYVAAWNEPDAAKRSSAIAALWAPDALGHKGHARIRRAHEAHPRGARKERRRARAFAFAPPRAPASAATS